MSRAPNESGSDHNKSVANYYVYRVTNKKSLIRSSVCLGLVGLVSGLLFSLTDQRAARATGPTTIISSYFTSTSDVTNASTNNWNVGGNSAAQNDTSAPQDSIGSCSTSPVKYPCMVNSSGDSAAPYHLRLTNATTGASNVNETGYAIYTIAQTSVYGLDFSFNASIHGYGGGSCPASPSDNWNNTSTGGLSNSQRDCQADGFSFILQNGSDTNTSSTVLGEPGGSLGYGSQNATGFDGGLVAVGFDAYGNNYQLPYGSNKYDPSTPCSGTDTSTGGNGGGDPANSGNLARKSLIIRGPEGYSSSTRTSANLSRSYGYCRIASQQDRSSWYFGSTSLSTNSGVSLATTNLFSTSGASIRIVIDPSDYTAGSRGTGFVYMGSVGSNPTTLMATFQLPQQLVSASTFRFGFVAGTGGGEAEMDVWGTSVQSIRTIPQVGFTNASNLCLVTGNSLTIQGQNGVAPYTISVAPGSSLPTGETLTATTATTSTLSGTGSTGGTFTLNITDANGVLTAQTFNLTIGSSCANLIWQINSASVGYAGQCTSGFYTQSVYSDSSGNYSVAKFVTPTNQNLRGTCTWTAPQGVNQITYLAVGGGGAGGYDGGGGGGGGIVKTSTSASVTPNALYNVTIGSGGLGAPSYSSGTGCSFDNGAIGAIGDSGTASSIVLASSNSTLVSAAGGGGGGGRCSSGSNNGGNSGGNGHKDITQTISHYTSINTSPHQAPYGSSYCIYYGNCDFAQATAGSDVGHSGGTASETAGGGGAGYAGNGGNASQSSSPGANDATWSSSSGANGYAAFANTPLNPSNYSYGGGGGGGTYCDHTGSGTQASNGTYPTETDCQWYQNVDFINQIASGGGSGGNGGTGSGNGTASAVSNTGGGGGGGGGYGTIQGQNGSGGIVYIEWRVPITTSANTISINLNVTSSSSISSAGTYAMLYSTLNDGVSPSSCGSTWSSGGTTSPTNNTPRTLTVIDTGTISSSTLVRGFCYKWTEDTNTVTGVTGLTSSSVSRPTDAASTTFGNLTSPILMLPSRPGVNLPSTVLVDPQTGQVQLTGIPTLSGAGMPQFCFFENDSSSIAGTSYGTVNANQNLTFYSPYANPANTDTNSTTFHSVWDSQANLQQILNNLYIKSLSPSIFSGTRYILIRTAPTLSPGFITDCTGFGAPVAFNGDLQPTTSDIYLLKIVPYDLSRTLVQPKTDLGHH